MCIFFKPIIKSSKFSVWFNVMFRSLYLGSLARSQKISRMKKSCDMAKKSETFLYPQITNSYLFFIKFGFVLDSEHICRFVFVSCVVRRFLLNASFDFEIGQKVSRLNASKLFFIYAGRYNFFTKQPESSLIAHQPPSRLFEYLPSRPLRLKSFIKNLLFRLLCPAPVLNQPALLWTFPPYLAVSCPSIPSPPPPLLRAEASSRRVKT